MPQSEIHTIDPDEFKQAGIIFGPCGMSLRDWFAGQAMAGILSGAEDGVHFIKAAPLHVGAIASQLYALADAMLEAREKGK